MPTHKDEKKGTWFVQCSYRDYTGSRIRTTKRGFSTRREALRWEKEFILKKEGALNMTMAAFYELYEADVKPSLKENTWNTKAHIIETKILPYLGDLKVNEITSADVLHWQNDVKELRDSSGQPLAQTYLRTISNQLSAMFNHAVRYYGLQANPMRRTGVCSQINVDTFGGRFSTLHAKTCRPSPIKPNLIVATSSIQKGRKDNDQHVRRKFYTAAEA